MQPEEEKDGPPALRSFQVEEIMGIMAKCRKASASPSVPCDTERNAPSCTGAAPPGAVAAAHEDQTVSHSRKRNKPRRNGKEL